jgi:hypothetical protein
MDTILNKINKGWYIKPSKRKNKKYDVFDENNKYILSYGNINYEHYFDRLKHYSHLNHGDEKRLNQFRKRFYKMYKKNIDNPYSSLLWSWHLLW